MTAPRAAAALTDKIGLAYVTDIKHASDFSAVHCLERITCYPGLWTGLLVLGNKLMAPSLPQRVSLTMLIMVVFDEYK